MILQIPAQCESNPNGDHGVVVYDDKTVRMYFQQVSFTTVYFKSTVKLFEGLLF